MPAAKNRAAARYFKNAYAQTGSWFLSTAAYIMGLPSSASLIL